MLSGPTCIDLDRLPGGDQLSGATIAVARGSFGAKAIAQLLGLSPEPEMHPSYVCEKWAAITCS
jgi:hypothetical protein